MEYIIEREIVMPAARGNHNFPLAGMEVGDSFFIAPEKNISKAKAHASISVWGKKNNKKFAVRKWEAGLRVWRVE